MYKPLFIFFLTILCFSSCRIENKNKKFDINIDVLRDNYQKNKVKSYVTFYSNSLKEVILLDSVEFDNKGNKNSIYQFDKTEELWSKNLDLVYLDSYYLIEKHFYDSFSDNVFFYSYMIDSTENKVIQFIASSNDSTSRNQRSANYYFNNNGSRIKLIESYYDGQMIDTVYFNYKNNKLTKVLNNRKNDKWMYIYNYENNMLKNIEYFKNNTIFQIDYVSPNSGLIDSTHIFKEDKKYYYRYHYY